VFTSLLFSFILRSKERREVWRKEFEQERGSN
jgi:hypothetical protein